MTRLARLARLVVSWIMVGIGVPLLIRAELGVAPFDVLNTGVKDLTGWSFGLAFIVDSIIFFFTGWMLGARLGWACVGGTLVIGVLVNAISRIVPMQERLLPRTIFLVVGILIIAIAICLVVTTELGPGPTEVVMLGLIVRGMGVIPARWISDGTPVAIGVLLGGAIGPGTLAFAVCMGPLVKFGLRRLHYQPAHHR